MSVDGEHDGPSDERSFAVQTSCGKREVLIGAALVGAGCLGEPGRSTVEGAGTPPNVNTGSSTGSQGETSSATAPSTDTVSETATATPTPYDTASETVVMVSEQPDGSPTRWNEAEAVMSRENSTTTYEALLPWEGLPIDRDTDKLGVAFLVNDNDGDGRTGWVEWGGGIGRNKEPATFNLAVLSAVEDVPESAYEIAEYTGSIDGTVVSGDIPSPNIDLDETGRVVAPGDTEPTIGGLAWFAWNDRGIHFAARVDDETHHQTYSAGEMWRGDTVQLGIAAGEPGASDTFQQINVGGNPP